MDVVKGRALLAILGGDVQFSYAGTVGTPRTSCECPSWAATGIFARFYHTSDDMLSDLPNEHDSRKDARLSREELVARQVDRETRLFYGGDPADTTHTAMQFHWISMT